MTKPIKLFLVLILVNFSEALARDNLFIVAKINDVIMTNYDIKKEASYLKILNPNLSQLNEIKVNDIAKNSLINEIVKKNELKKFFKFNNELDLIDQIFKDFYTNLNFNSEKQFEKFLKKQKSYSIEEVKEKIKTEFYWNRLIFQRFNNQVKINKEQLKQKVKNSSNFKNQYLISEIFFSKDKNESIESKIDKIKQSINNVGFNNTASLFSISESANTGGKIGWIQEENLSPKILKELYKIKTGDITNVIQIGNNYLLLKIEDIKTKKIKTNNEIKLKEMIDFERNRQLNQFSSIYYNKIKINYSIDEK
tara:strand:- start:1372 stop:2298 length:927 start_codon:yes stop_codon:yes gene_type:complete